MASWQLVVITGASKGFGRALALAHASLFTDGRDLRLHFVLTGRSISDLEDSQEAIQTLLIERNLCIEEFDIDLCASDLTELDRLTDVCVSLFDTPLHKHPERSYERVVFYNNAGSLGQLGVSLIASPSSVCLLCV